MYAHKAIPTRESFAAFMLRDWALPVCVGACMLRVANFHTWYSNNSNRILLTYRYHAIRKGQVTRRFFGILF